MLFVVSKLDQTQLTPSHHHTAPEDDEMDPGKHQIIMDPARCQHGDWTSNNAVTAHGLLMLSLVYLIQIGWRS